MQIKLKLKIIVVLIIKYPAYLNDFVQKKYIPVWPKKINNMFLRHFFLENDAGGRLFIFIFFE